MGKTASLANIGSIADSSLGFRNRIINGAMVIDQRNAGASVTGTGFSVDRFYNAFTGTNATQQRSTTAPQGFTNSLLATVTTATAPGSSSLAYISQTIEGFNVADMDLGKATAVASTLSFWVRSSVTGTYATALLNGAQNRSYVATYTINAANTWEYKTVTVAGDTAGTWLTDNGKGLCIFWDLGSGSNYQTTAGSWQNGTFLRTSGSVNFANTSGATFYITGVQLEKGSTATSFDYRPYGTELQLCQRYYWQCLGVNGYPVMWFGSGANVRVSVKHSVTMRSAPSVTKTGTVAIYSATVADASNTTYTSVNNDVDGSIISFTTTGAGASANGLIGYTYGTGSLQFSSEL